MRYLLISFLTLTFFNNANAQHFIGEKFGGGIVFKVDVKGEHGLIAAPANLKYRSREEFSFWEVNRLLDSSHLKKVDSIPYKDWRLPTKDELNDLYIKRDVVGMIINSNDANYQYYRYWSSTEGTKGEKAWFQYFYSGNQVCWPETLSAHVRPIRSF